MPVLIMLTPYAPHIAAELWQVLGGEGEILDAAFPVFNPQLIQESSKNYPVSINGKMRTSMEFPLDADKDSIQTAVLENEVVKKWVDNNPIKKFIFVPNKMINVVI